MSTSTPQHTVTPTDVGDRVQLATYTHGDQERIIFGQRVSGVVRVTDHPADGQGRRYLIERGLEHDGYGALTALVNDYLAQAATHHTIPAIDTPVDRYLTAVS